MKQSTFIIGKDCKVTVGLLEDFLRSLGLADVKIMNSKRTNTVIVAYRRHETNDAVGDSTT